MNPFTDLITRLRSLFRREREDAETEEELRFHLEMETAKNLRAGMSPVEAHGRARLRLGGVDAIREAVRDARGGRPLEDLLRDFGYALRGARRNPAFTLAAIVSLAIPIGFNTTLFAICTAAFAGPARRHGEARRAACPAHGLTSPARRMATRHPKVGLRQAIRPQARCHKSEVPRVLQV